MSGIKISLITVTYNAAGTIGHCISSVIAQTYPNVEHIVIDGQSTDATSAIIKQYQKNIHQYISEPDYGIYDAMNKGIRLATGDIVGMLNADDYFADENVLSDVARAFELSDADIIYGDIDYVDNTSKIIRKWRSGEYKTGSFNWGWMPPHPSFYVRRKLFDTAGTYMPQYGSATDYELMLRFIHTKKFKVYYLNKVLVKMRIGGISNNNLHNRLKAWGNDYLAMKNNGILFPHISLLLKPFRKIIQYIT